MGKEKNLIRVFCTEDNKLGVSCDTNSEEEFEMVVYGLFSLLEETPAIMEGLQQLAYKKNLSVSTVLSLNQSKIKS